MLKVLAAESSDPGRLRRAKSYAATGAVLDIDIAPGTVTVEVQGSRSTPYIAQITVRPGTGMPLRRDLHFACTCPDDSDPCKHALAGMLALSDEVLLEPELLATWRNDTTPVREIRRGHLSLVPPPGTRRPEPIIDEHPPADLDDFLRAPAGVPIPEPVALDPFEAPAPLRPELADVVRDALAHARIDWG
jgi:hypothetical protein